MNYTSPIPRRNQITEKIGEARQVTGAVVKLSGTSDLHQLAGIKKLNLSFMFLLDVKVPNRRSAHALHRHEVSFIILPMELKGNRDLLSHWVKLNPL